MIICKLKGAFYTDKRVVAVFSVLCIAVGCICLRLYNLCVGSTEYAAENTHCYTLDICSVRGEILDCRGEKLTDADFTYAAAAKPTEKAAAALKKVLDTDSFNLISEKMRKGNAVCVDTGKALTEPNDDITVIRKETRYADGQPARHILGYLDADGRGAAGVEKSFDSLLYTGKTKQVRFYSDAYGRIISGAQTQLVNTNVKRSSVTLTIDSAIQQIAENAIDEAVIKTGGAVVTDIKTGAIRAMVSRPVYDAYNLKEYLNDKNSPMLNRGLEAFAVGSAFKVLVSAAALENGISDCNYRCTGSCTVDGVTFHCNNGKAHGELNMQKALECSCNTYFINLAKQIGAEKLLEAARSVGFGQEIKLADGIISKAGVLPGENELKKTGQLANFSFGQGSFTASMMQLVQMITAASGSGRYCIPYLVEKTEDIDGTVTEYGGRYPVTAFSEKTSVRLRKMLVSVVENGNASKAKPESGISAAGKTATAQTGSFDENGNEICNTWFCGFFPADSPRYAVVVLKQGGNSGAEDCAPVFGKIADEIIKEELTENR